MSLQTNAARYTGCNFNLYQLAVWMRLRFIAGCPNWKGTGSSPTFGISSPFDRRCFASQACYHSAIQWVAIALVIAKNISVRSKITQTNMQEVNSFLSQNRVSFLSKHQTCNPLDNSYGNKGEVCHRRDWEWRQGKIYFCEKHSRLSIKRTLPWSGHFNEADTSIKRILSFGL